MSKDELIRRIRNLKTRLAAGNAVGRVFVPLVEVCEFSLSHGWREVISRSRMRLGHSGRPAGRMRYPFPKDHDGPFSPIRIPPAADPTTSIIIPVLNQAAMTHQCLESIIRETPTGSYEVIVVDNASNERMQRMLAVVDGVVVVRNETNQGFVTASNQGAAQARGKYLVFLNNDTIVLPGWHEALLSTFARHANVGAVGGRLIFPNDRLQEAGGIVWSNGHASQYGHGGDPDASEYNFVREVDYCSGACLMVPKTLFESLGGFDARYAPAYYEDVDLAFRLRELSMRVLYQPAASVIHFEGATAGKNVSKGLKRYQVINRDRFAERHAGALKQQYPQDPGGVPAARERSRRPHALVMDHMVPHYDEDAGSVRMLALLEILIDLGYRVTFVPDNLHPAQPYTAELQQLGIEVVYRVSTPVDYVAAHAREFDLAILCRAPFAQRYLPALTAVSPRPRIIFDTVDLHFLREERHAELEGNANLAAAAARTRQAELDVMRASDQVWVTSTHEEELLGRFGVPPLGLVPMIHEVRPDVPPFRDRRDILFIGGFRHAPNEDAVRFFVSEVLPLVRHELPDVKFLIVGSHVPPAIAKLESDHVRVMGFVRDVVPVFDSCRLTVAPIRFGAGVKGKVTQSLAWGVPAVITPVAAEGLRLVDRQHVMIAADPHEFARRVVELHRDEPTWTRLSVAGRRHVEEHLSRKAVRASVAALLDQLRPDAARLLATR